MEEENSKKTKRKLPILPIELLSKIIKLLPLKSIIYFSCIPIIRHALILHPKPYKSPNPLIFTLHGIYIYIIETYNNSFHPNPKKIPLPNELLEKYFNNSNVYDVEILGSCNGILCIYSNHHDVIALVNPLTGAHKTLPRLGDTKSRNLGSRNLGFGYDFENDDYKVFNIWMENHVGTYVDIYSSKNDSWERVLDSKQYYVQANNSRGAFWKGYMHWLLWTNRNNMTTIVLRYNLHGGKGLELAHVDLSGSIGYDPYRQINLVLAVVDSKLCFYDDDDDDSIRYENRWRTWIVEHCDFEENKTIKAVLGLDIPTKKCRPIVWSSDRSGDQLMVLGGSVKGRDKLMMYDKLFRYDPSKKKLSPIHLRGMPRRFLKNVVLDFPSFASP